MYRMSPEGAADVRGRTPHTTVAYESFADDFVSSTQQDYALPADYTWLDESRAFRVKAAIARACGHMFAACYCRLALSQRIENRHVLDEAAAHGGCFLYGNHTQPIGDACTPLLAAHPARAYVVVSPANFKTPVIGPALSYLGALPTATTLAGGKQLMAAVRARLAQGNVVTVYPEAHVWPWHAHVRPLSTSAFALPVATGRPVFTMTRVYEQRRLRARPRSRVYIDGPFTPDESLPAPERKRALRDDVEQAMRARSGMGTAEHIRYEPAPGAPAIPRGSRSGEPLNIMYCGDGYIERGLLISALSLAQHTARPLHVWVLTARIAGKAPVGADFARFLEGLLREHNAASTVRLVDMTDAFEAEPPEANMGTRFTPCCMLRLYADKVDGMPQRVLYLDTDVVCTACPDALYDTPLCDAEFAGTLDYYGRFFFRRRLWHMDYMNSGVLLMNIARMRQTGLLAKCRQRCAGTRMFMPDQTALNKLATRKLVLPRRFNDQRRQHDDTVMRHFSNCFGFFPPRLIDVKPWQTQRVHDELHTNVYDKLLGRCERAWGRFEHARAAHAETAGAAQRQRSGGSAHDGRPHAAGSSSEAARPSGAHTPTSESHAALGCIEEAS